MEVKHVLAAGCALVFASCSGASKPPCTADDVTALRSLYTRAARDVIESGACDGVKRVEDCTEYMLVEKHFELAGKAICK